MTDKFTPEQRQRLNSARVGIAGAGGLGSNVAMPSNAESEHFVKALERVAPSVDQATFDSYQKMGRDIKKRRTGWDTVPFYG